MARNPNGARCFAGYEKSEVVFSVIRQFDLKVDGRSLEGAWTGPAPGDAAASVLNNFITGRDPVD